MSIAAPGPVVRKWRATGDSINGQVEYQIVIEAMLDTTAREMLREYVVQHVRERYGVTPRGVAWLVDPRTIRVHEVGTSDTEGTQT